MEDEIRISVKLAEVILAHLNNPDVHAELLAACEEQCPSKWKKPR